MSHSGCSRGYKAVRQKLGDLGPCDLKPGDPEGKNPMGSVVENLLQMFIMTLGGFGDIWEEIHETQYIMIGKIHWFLFIALLVILLLNLLIAMMGDTYAKIAEIKNEWMRQWARTVLIVERSISPKERLRQQNRYCDIDTQ